MGTTTFFCNEEYRSGRRSVTDFVYWFNFILFQKRYLQRMATFVVLEAYDMCQDRVLSTSSKSISGKITCSFANRGSCPSKWFGTSKLRTRGSETVHRFRTYIRSPWRVIFVPIANLRRLKLRLICFMIKWFLIPGATLLQLFFYDSLSSLIHFTNTHTKTIWHSFVQPSLMSSWPFLRYHWDFF